MFDLMIISPQRVLFNDAVNRVFLDGDDGEYESLSFHAHLVGILQQGSVIIDEKKAFPINKGIVQFYENKCTILVEEIGSAQAVPAPKT